MSFNPEIFKRQFPIFSHPENCDLVYLDNAATTQKPQIVIDAITDFYSRSNANAHRSSHRLALQATLMLEQTRQAAAEFFKASQQEIIFTSGATDAVNLLASSIGKTLSAGDEIILSTAEHHANLVPWQLVAKEKGVKLLFLEDKNTQPDINSLHALCSEKTRVVSLTAASNVFGFKLDLSDVKNSIPDKAVFIIDASQLAAHQNPDVKQTPCDFMFCSAHKFYGPTGVGLLYANKNSLDSLPVYRAGGEMVKNVELFQSTFMHGPQRFEAGTSSLASIAGLKAALEFLAQHDREAMHAYEKKLLQYCHQQLKAIPEIQLLTSSENNIGICSFILTDPHNEFDLVSYLNEQDIAVRLGHHCAQPLLQSRDLEAVVRVSISAYNSKEDIDALITSIKEFYLTQEENTSNPEQVKVADQESRLIYFQNLKSWQEKNKCLMQWGAELKRYPEIRFDKNLVKGCESKAWLTINENSELLFESDSKIIRGLMVLLAYLIQEAQAKNQTLSQQIIEQRFQQLELEKHLSPSRSNGFKALLKASLTLLPEQKSASFS